MKIFKIFEILPFTNYHLLITIYQLPFTNYHLPITIYQITIYQLPITNYHLPLPHKKIFIKKISKFNFINIIIIIIFS